MAKKDKKSKEAEKKARNAQKQEKKATKKEKKQKSRGKQEVDSDADDVDIDAILEEYARQQEQFLKVIEEVSEPPSPRSSSTILASPANDNELFVFGGEYFNGSLASFYNDLFIYNINRDEWKKVTSPNSPLPRSGHAWCRGGNAGGMYLFGGEFSSPKQGTFYHYNDFWRLDPASREWTRIEGKGKASSPPSRSGHRMTYFKNYIILFGGFQDTSQQTKYLNDLWIYDCTTFKWHEPKLPPGSGKPDARSSFSLLPHESGAVLYGGYSRVKATASTSQKSAKGSSRPMASRVVLKPVVHQDSWFLKITQPPSDAPSDALPTVRWERRKRPVNSPNPPRAGATMAAHRGRGIMFGGVHDVEESEEGMDSEFFDNLFVWNVDRNRYFPLTLRRPKATSKKAAPERSRRERGKQAEEDLLRNLKALEIQHSTDLTEDTAPNPAEPQESAKSGEVEKPVVFEMPHPRFNAQLTVQDDVLYIFGGTFEKDDREYTFDEMWAIDLNKLDGVKEIYRRELLDWIMDEESEEEDDEEEDEDEDDDEDSETEVASITRSTAEILISTPAPSAVDEVTTIEEASSFADGLPFPRPFESLRDFYDRTRVQWQEIVIESIKESSESMALTPKEISAKAFGRAEDKWWDCREEIRALEDEQAEAGIDSTSIISLADKQGGSSGAGRRR
jgi:N-acetylneuraminic acid mutarotase